MKINFSSYPFFAGMIILQLAVPAFMIVKYETTVVSGKEFRFRTAPIDPEDPFRGKYITLSYEATSFLSNATDMFSENQEVFVSLQNDSLNFVKISNISSEEPSGADFVTGVVSYIDGEPSGKINISYSFNRFYMEETRAPRAEQVFGNATRERKEDTYALVSVYKGKAVVKDVFIGEVSIKELAKETGE